MKYSSLTALEVVKMTTSWAANDEKFVKMISASVINWLSICQMRYFGSHSTAIIMIHTKWGSQNIHLFAISFATPFIYTRLSSKMEYKRKHDPQWRAWNIHQNTQIAGQFFWPNICKCYSFKAAWKIPSHMVSHQMETVSALLTICAGNSPVTGEFPAQRPVKRSFDVFSDLRLNKRLSKQ